MRPTRLNKFFVPRLLGLMVVTLCIFVSGGIALGYVVARASTHMTPRTIGASGSDAQVAHGGTPPTVTRFI